MFEAARFKEIQALLENAPMPAVSAAVVTRTGPIFTHQHGIANLETGEALTPAHSYDLASLTKVLVTLPAVLDLLEAGVWTLERRLDSFYPQLEGKPLGQATLENLLTHTSGQHATQPLQHTAHSRLEVIGQILEMDTPNSLGHYEYSDLGFILLGDLLERQVTGDPAREMPLLGQDSDGLQVTGVGGLYPLERLALERGHVRYRPDVQGKGPCVATEFDSWRGRIIQGEVHDEKAYVMDGVAGHAGAFGTLEDVIKAARFWLETSEQWLALMTAPRVREKSGCPRGLGWVLGYPTCSGGTLASARAFGHTGFTGTSLWVEPERGYATVLLTNRVHPTRETGDEIITLRREFADAVHRAMSGEL